MRSVLESERAVRSIAGHTATRIEPVLKSLGLLRGQLEFAADNLLDVDIDRLVKEALSAVVDTGNAVRENYFRPVGSIVWSH